MKTLKVFSIVAFCAVHCYNHYCIPGNFCFIRPDSPALKRSRVDDDEDGDESVNGGRLGVPSPDSIRVTQVSVRYVVLQLVSNWYAKK